MFNEKMTMEEYFSKYKTIQDIKAGLKPDIEKSIILSEDDDSALDLESRFSNCIDLNDIPFENVTDAKAFWLQLFGHLAQAFDIMIMCSEYKLIPYIRYNVALYYLLNLSSNFGEILGISKDVLFKSSVVHKVHHLYDKECINGIDFIKYCNFIKSFGFERRLFKKLANEGITFETSSIIKTETIIMDQLIEVYNMLRQIK